MGGWVLDHRSGTSTSRLARGRSDIGDRVSLAALDELPPPPLVESPVAFVAADPGGWCGKFPVVARDVADDVAGAVVSRGLDEESAHVGLPVLVIDAPTRQQISLPGDRCFARASGSPGGWRLIDPSGAPSRGDTISG